MRAPPLLSCRVGMYTGDITAVRYGWDDEGKKSFSEGLCLHNGVASGAVARKSVCWHGGQTAKTPFHGQRLHLLLFLLVLAGCGGPEDATLDACGRVSAGQGVRSACRGCSMPCHAS